MGPLPGWRLVNVPEVREARGAGGSDPPAAWRSLADRGAQVLGGFQPDFRRIDLVVAIATEVRRPIDRGIVRVDKGGNTAEKPTVAAAPDLLQSG